MKMGMPAQHCMEHWVIMALGYTRKERGNLGSAQQVLAIWHINIILGAETLQDISVSHPTSVIIFVLSPMTDSITERYPRYLKIGT
jgi:hypothetical protein